tara:strand:+ start:56797 stop:57114 length:318 start_codon:yes stop_codon:yes gene_type:complete
MTTHKATLISIIAEKLIHDGVTRILKNAGATGYSFFEGAGKGGHGLHPAHRPSIVDDFAIVKTEVVVKDRRVAEKIAAEIAEAYFAKYSGIIYMDEVDVLRPEKF